jgi:hypothetical protein
MPPGESAGAAHGCNGARARTRGLVHAIFRRHVLPRFQAVRRHPLRPLRFVLPHLIYMILTATEEFREDTRASSSNLPMQPDGPNQSTQPKQF